jgi:hypothetical protein
MRAYSLQIASIRTDEGDPCAVDIFHSDGSRIASGLAVTQADALLNAICSMLPADHPKYPKSAPTPDPE